MSYYIYLDINGNEIKREDKGRGRPKKESVERQDGNFYITEGQNAFPLKATVSKEKPVNKSVIHTNIVDNIEKQEEIVDSGQEHFKIRKTDKKTTLANLLKCLAGLPRQPIFEKHKVIILRPAVMNDIGIDETIKTNGVYGKIEVNLQENVIYVWSTYWDKDKNGNIVRPDFIIKNVLDIKSDIVSENL